MKTNRTATQEAPASTCFRQYLQHELARRCSDNPRYSLRSFALRLEIDHSTLSQLMRGKRPLTERMIEKLGSRLGLNCTAIESFVAREKQLAAQRPHSMGQVRQLTRDAVSIVSDLHHFAILELVRLKEFKPDSRWIARVLGISVDEVNMALSRLLRVGLLEMAHRSHWTNTTGHATASIEDLAFVAAERMMEQVRRLTGRPTDQHGLHTQPTSEGEPEWANQ